MEQYRLMTRSMLLLLCLLMSSAIWSATSYFKVNNVAYEITSTTDLTVSVTYQYDTKQSLGNNLHDLDFSSVNDVQAYIASSLNTQTGIMMMVPVTEVPAGVGVMLKGSAGTYRVPFKKSSIYHVNMLVGTPGGKQFNETDAQVNNYLVEADGEGVTLHLIVAGNEVAAGSAYLSLPAAVVPVSNQITLAFCGESSGLKGDVNGDGTITAQDASLILQIVAKKITE